MSILGVPEIRAVTSDGKLGEILPDWGSLAYMDDSTDIGTVQFEYAGRGLRADLIRPRREFCLTLDGEELPNGRFILDEDSSNRATDSPDNVSWSGKTLLMRTEEALCPGLNDKGDRLDQYTPEDALVYAQEIDQFVDEQLIAEEVAQGRANLLTLPDGREEVPLSAYPKAQTDVASYQNDSVAPVGRTWKNVTPGAVVRAYVMAARQRGFPLTVDFTATLDSNGVPWQATALYSGTPEPGSSILELIRDVADKKLAEPGVKGRTLRLFNSTYGTTDDAKAEFAVGKNMIDGPKQGSATDLVTTLYVVSDAGPHGWVQIPSLVAAYGTIEGKLDVEGLTTWEQCKAAGEAAILDAAREKLQNTFGIVPSVRQGTVPYKNFGIRDWVYVDLDGVPSKQRVRAITLAWDSNRTLQAGITTNDRLYERSLVRYSKTITKK